MKPYRITNQTGYHVSPLSAIITAKDAPSLGSNFHSDCSAWFSFPTLPSCFAIGSTNAVMCQGQKLIGANKNRKVQIRTSRKAKIQTLIPCQTPTLDIPLGPAIPAAWKYQIVSISKISVSSLAHEIVLHTR